MGELLSELLTKNHFDGQMSNLPRSSYGKARQQPLHMTAALSLAYLRIYPQWPRTRDAPLYGEITQGSK